MNFTLLRLDREGPISDNRGENCQGFSRQKNYCGKGCKFSSLNGVVIRLFMLNVIGRDFSSRKLHVC